MRTRAQRAMWDSRVPVRDVDAPKETAGGGEERGSEKRSGAEERRKEEKLGPPPRRLDDNTEAGVAAFMRTEQSEENAL